MATWEIHPEAASLDPTAQIEVDSAGLADAAAGNLDAPVEYCPGWLVADLVWHLRGVHHFWAEIVARSLTDPHDVKRFERPDDAQLVGDFRDGAERLVSVLRTADPAAPVWTWAPQRDAGFVIRHQVQETSVHRWDAEHAARNRFSIDLPTAVDSIEEFLTFSTDVSDATPLGEALLLAATDADAAWIVEDGPNRAVRWRRGQAESPGAELRANASDLLLWLYGRAEPDAMVTGDTDVLDRFRTHLDTA
jgi:uncharacterized protein (TIGR03083 family)